jgi:hypothetical protein
MFVQEAAVRLGYFLLVYGGMSFAGLLAVAHFPGLYEHR